MGYDTLIDPTVNDVEWEKNFITNGSIRKVRPGYFKIYLEIDKLRTQHKLFNARKKLFNENYLEKLTSNNN